MSYNDVMRAMADRDMRVLLLERAERAKKLRGDAARPKTIGGRSRGTSTDEDGCPCKACASQGEATARR